MESIKQKKLRTPKEKPTPIHVCREPQTGKYKVCNQPKKKKK